MKRDLGSYPKISNSAPKPPNPPWPLSRNYGYATTARTNCHSKWDDFGIESEILDRI